MHNCSAVSACSTRNELVCATGLATEWTRQACHSFCGPDSGGKRCFEATEWTRRRNGSFCGQARKKRGGSVARKHLARMESGRFGPEIAGRDGRGRRCCQRATRRRVVGSKRMDSLLKKRSREPSAMSSSGVPQVMGAATEAGEAESLVLPGAASRLVPSVSG